MTQQQRERLLQALAQSGVFITSGEGANVNIMSLHWGTLGNCWNKPVFVLPVRKGKLTHELIDEHKSFGVCVPFKDMRKQLMQCDHLSGRSVNKFEELHLHPRRPKAIAPYLISECGMFLECKVIFAAEMNADNIDIDLRDEMYGERDFHTLYFAEILECYSDNE